MDKSKPLAAFRKRLGANSPGIAIGVVAIVIALTGAAFAAGGLTASQTKQVKKIAQTEAKKFAKQGPKGEAGPVGPAGQQGSKGDAGSPGASGKDGISAEATSFTGAKGSCAEGGVEVKSAKPAAFVCDGEEGEPGQPGSPWTAGGVLPPGATETGVWSFNGTTEDTAGIRTAISFPIPLKENIASTHIHFGEAGESPEFEAACPSISAFNPKAEPGELCIYPNSTEGFENATFDGAFKLSEFSGKGAVQAGAMLKFTPTGVAYGAGSFAVTGCDSTTGATTFACP
jgi:hypothetical protein